MELLIRNPDPADDILYFRNFNTYEKLEFIILWQKEKKWWKEFWLRKQIAQKLATGIYGLTICNTPKAIYSTKKVIKKSLIKTSSVFDFYN